MPGAIVYDKDAALRQGIAGAGSAFAQAIQYNALEKQKEEQRKRLAGEDQQKRTAYGTILSNTIANIPQNASSLDIAGALSNMIEKGVPLDYVKGIMPLFEPQLKGAVQDQQSRSFLENLGIIDPQQNVMSLPQSNAAPQSIQPPTQLPNQAPNVNQQQTKVTPQNKLEGLTENQLIAMQGSGIPRVKAVADAERSRRDMVQKNFRADRDFAYKRAGKFFEKLEDEADRIGDQREALGNMENAITEGNTEFFSTDNFANFLGKYGEGLRTAKGAQLLNAQKEFLVSDIGRVGSRPNQWIEQQISSALTKIGRSDEANMAVVSALKARLERGEAKQKIARELENYYLQTDGTIPANFTNIVKEAMKPEEEKIKGKLAYKLRQYYEQENSSNLRNKMREKVTAGTPLTIQMAALFLEKYGDKEKASKMAKQMGYEIPTPDEYRRYIK